MHICAKCKAEKPKSEFYKNTHMSSKTGVSHWCKDCSKEHNRKWRAENKDRAAQIQREAKIRSYGITVDEYQALVTKQNNCCAICGETSEKSLSIDHDHSTEKVRGLLCNNCNTAIGLLKDAPEVVYKAYEYLGKHKERHK